MTLTTTSMLRSTSIPVKPVPPSQQFEPEPTSSTSTNTVTSRRSSGGGSGQGLASKKPPNMHINIPADEGAERIPLCEQHSPLALYEICKQLHPPE
ncbi:Protein CBG26382 [Caenorhabditis briggsae]|uniref:Protein CBG26382 n=1 Tax=Caenorhabditis briggsae TaxID=6238 RepID=B6IG48_CAEBR|nr:Protein CBG26382 [Caenorhabditis briggsae]CAR98878.1 Protein CBG26382 [Caenorhabditis briggsae]